MVVGMENRVIYKHFEIVMTQNKVKDSNNNLLY